MPKQTVTLARLQKLGRKGIFNAYYQTKAFGVSSAVSYLRLMYKTSRSKRVLARIIGNQEKMEYFTYMMQACKEKLEELGK